MKSIPRVGVIGAGFVGMAVSTGFEQLGIEVREYDKYKDTESLSSVVNNSDVLFVCVPTPMDENGWCDTSIVASVANDINKVAESRKVIVLKSTVEPGTTEELASAFNKHSWIFNPEFLTQKNFINDFLEQDRVLLGVTNGCLKKDVKAVARLYKEFTKKQTKPGKIYEVSSNVAEMVKYAGNCFLATKVAFFNEIYDVCKIMNIDYENVAELVAKDDRIGASHTKVPGPDGLRGFGGSCFPKDVNALIALAESYDINPIVLSSVWAKNLSVREKEDWKEIKGATTENSYDET